MLKAFASRPHPDRRDNRDETLLFQGLDDGRVHPDDLPHEADVHLLHRAVFPGHLLEVLPAEKQTAVLAGQSHGLAAVQVQVTHHFPVHLAGQHHLHHAHGGRVGDPHPAHEIRDDAVTLQGLVDLGSAAVDDHRVDADVLHQDHVQGETALERLVDHGVPAVLDHHRAAAELTHVGQGLHQHLGPGDLLAHFVPVCHCLLLVSVDTGACKKNERHSTPARPRCKPLSRAGRQKRPGGAPEPLAISPGTK